MTRLDKPVPGKSTAMPLNVSYRVDRIADLIAGKWLDLGCAEGGYAAELLSRGATEVVGVDADETRVAEANSRNLPAASFQVALSEKLPFPAEDFDGVFMNEVLEHVTDEEATLSEIFRVLRPGGRLVLISPNRWFPFEGHGLRTSRFSTDTPVPLLPWLPQSLAGRWMAARNYWPRELLKQAKNAGFTIERFGFIWPVLEVYPWLPPGLRDGYQARIRFFDSVPVLRRFGVSTLIVGRKAS